MNLDNYRELVERLARRRDGEAFFNESLDHAAIITENMFGHARKRVSILTGKLDARVYGPQAVVDKAKLFLVDPSHSVRILIEECGEELREHPFISTLCCNRDACGAVGKHDNLEIRQVPERFQDRYGFHFLVVDGDSYRFENDRATPSAVACFGDKSGSATHIEKIFEFLWDACKPPTTNGK